MLCGAYLTVVEQSEQSFKHCDDTLEGMVRFPTYSHHAINVFTWATSSFVQIKIE
jgi:hypothetical protein